MIHSREIILFKGSALSLQFTRSQADGVIEMGETAIEFLHRGIGATHSNFQQRVGADGIEIEDVPARFQSNMAHSGNDSYPVDFLERTFDHRRSGAAIGNEDLKLIGIESIAVTDVKVVRIRFLHMDDALENMEGVKAPLAARCEIRKRGERPLVDGVSDKWNGFRFTRFLWLGLQVFLTCFSFFLE